MLAGDGLCDETAFDVPITIASQSIDDGVHWHADGSVHSNSDHSHAADEGIQYLDVSPHSAHVHIEGDPETCCCPDCMQRKDAGLAEDPAHDHAAHELRYTSTGAAFFYDAPYYAAASTGNADGGDGTAASSQEDDAKFGLDEIPALHSNPGAPAILYLDFDGQIVDKTDWNLGYDSRPIHAAPYDTDDDATTFSQTELEVIEEVWRRVSEDYIPFNVDVTTEKPDESLLRGSRGAIRAVISTNYDDVDMGGSGEKWHSDVGGVALVNSWVGNPDHPVWVFHNLVPPTAKGIAEATSHEFGHSFGLFHQGRNGEEYYDGHGEGETGWAPIMGTGYSKNVTQWTDARYSGATTAQNDFAIILRSTNQISLREDDIGVGSDEAVLLSVADGWVTGSGVVDRISGGGREYDTFQLDHLGGPLNLHIAPAAIGPNLDVLVTLYDADEDEIAMYDSPESIDVWLQTELAAGTYYIDIESGEHFPEEGEGYSSYGSVGSYTIEGHTGTPPLTAVPGGEFGWQVGGQYRVDEGEDVTLDAGRSYGPSDQLTYRWDIDGDGDFDDATGVAPAVTWEQLSQSSPLFDSGQYEVAVRVSDDLGNVDEQASTLLVRNLRPVVEEVDEVTTSRFTRTRFDVAATDLEADPLTYEWKVYFVDIVNAVEEEIDLIDTGSDPFMQYAFDAAGSYEVRVRVSDDDGGRSSVVIPVTVTTETTPAAILEASVVDGDTVGNLSSVSLTFNQDVSSSLDVTNLVIFDTTTNFPIDLSGRRVRWDKDAFRAEYQFNEIPDGEYRLSLSGLSVGGVSFDGNGNGAAGGKWLATVTVGAVEPPELLVGDINGDLVVNFADFLILSANYGNEADDGDLDGNRMVNFADFLMLSDNFGKDLR